MSSKCLHVDYDHRDQKHSVPSLRSLYAALHQSPISWSSTHGGFWILSSYDDVRGAGKDWKTFSSADTVGLPVDRDRPVVPALWQDPPEHTIWRRQYNAWLTPERVSQYAPAIVELTEHHVGRFVAAGGGDFVADVSEALPVEIIAHTLGLESVAREMRHLTAMWMTTGEMDVRTELLALLAKEIQVRKDRPVDDFLSSMFTVEIGGRPITDQELLGWLVGGVIAGHETTLLAGAGLALELAQDPNLQARLAAEPEVVPAAVEEALRLHGSVHSFFRTVQRDTEMHGEILRKGDKVMLLFAAGNLDGSRYENPLEFRLDRYPSRHLSFGWGIHRCAGAALATHELQTLATVLLRNPFKLAGEPLYSPPKAGGNFIGIAELPLSYAVDVNEDVGNVGIPSV